MLTFFCKLNPPRLTFAADMTPEEGAVMQSHAEYWTEWTTRGHVVAFGLVGDPAGAYGIGIVEFENEAGVRGFTDRDPAILSNRGFRYDVLPMPLGVAHRGARSGGRD